MNRMVGNEKGFNFGQFGGWTRGFGEVGWCWRSEGDEERWSAVGCDLGGDIYTGCGVAYNENFLDIIQPLRNIERI
jgi:hypothetical protein